MSAHAAAKAGLGVILGSLALCTEDLASNALVWVSTETLRFDSGYWMTAKADKLPRKQWDDLVLCLCDAAEKYYRDTPALTAVAITQSRTYGPSPS